MTLAGALSQGAQKPRRAAFPETLRDRLPDDEYEALVSLLARPTEWSATAIALLLEEHHNIVVSARAIRDQRRRFTKVGV